MSSDRRGGTAFAALCWGLSGGIAGLLMANGWDALVLYVIGLNDTAPAVAAMVAMVESVTASLFGLLVLGESLVGLQLIGMGLILLTVTGLGVYSSVRPVFRDRNASRERSAANSSRSRDRRR